LLFLRIVVLYKIPNLQSAQPTQRTNIKYTNAQARVKGRCFKTPLKFFLAHPEKNHAAIFAPIESIKNKYQITCSNETILFYILLFYFLFIYNIIENKLFKSYLVKLIMKNKKVVIYSILALGFIALTFLVDWLFIIGALILIYLNQRELMKK